MILLRRVKINGVATTLAVDESGAHDLGRSMAALLGLGVDEFHAEVEAALAGPTLADPPPPLSPVDDQEIWACGVTYERSRAARTAESEHSADVYDLVYEAERPELFLKATPARVAAPGAPVRIRRDSTWDVPEPELALVLNSDGEIVAYAVADDMSSRSIEAANPLYLPQAKLFDDCVGIASEFALAREIGDGTDLEIQLTIERDGTAVFDGTISTGQMHRSFNDLIDHLFRETSFPAGVVLLTGTGLVPGDDFTLAPGDRVRIAIERVGVLEHDVYRAD